MACPYFRPRGPLPWSKWPGKLRPPLGDLYGGECRARGQPFSPSEQLLVNCCNMGYAGAECSRFPSGEGPEAVRFGVTGDDGRTVEIAYVVERGHLPIRHGKLRYCRDSSTWSGLNVDILNADILNADTLNADILNADGLNAETLLVRQAEACLASYLRSKDGESGLAASQPPKSAAAGASGR